MQRLSEVLTYENIFEKPINDKLSDRTIVISIMQGINRYAVSVLQYLIASESTSPNVEAGGFMPTPKNEKTASAAKYPGNESERKTMAVGQRFGSSSLVIMRQLDAPIA